MNKSKSSKDYVLNHDYGYGQKEEKEELNKLKLRNVNDLNVYVDEAVINAFNATYKDKVLQFKNDKSKCKIIVETI